MHHVRRLLAQPVVKEFPQLVAWPGRLDLPRHFFQLTSSNAPQVYVSGSMTNIPQTCLLLQTFRYVYVSVQKGDDLLPGLPDQGDVLVLERLQCPGEGRGDLAPQPVPRARLLLRPFVQPTLRLQSSREIVRFGLCAVPGYKSRHHGSMR